MTLVQEARPHGSRVSKDQVDARGFFSPSGRAVTLVRLDDIKETHTQTQLVHVGVGDRGVAQDVPASPVALSPL